jgi:5'-phosphate synthase pdxT subunit
MPIPFGVLALQGDFAAHAAAFRDLSFPVREVRRVAELEGLAGVVIPGGESTTLLNLMRDEPWFEALRRLHASGAVVAGTCAGAILLSREVRPRQPSLALLDAVIERNAWGRQVDSFEARVEAPALGEPLDAVFIRAPRFRALFPEVEVLARYAGEPVLVRQGRVVAATFHPELTRSRALHRHLVALAGERGDSARPAASSPYAGPSIRIGPSDTQPSRSRTTRYRRRADRSALRK